MSATQKAVTEKQQNAPMTIAQELEVLKPEIAKVLPEHVTPEKFMRVVATAIAQSPDLRQADRRSLLTSCVKAAQDGLLPDGREAALVIYNMKEKSGGWTKKVQYMPMVAGILKKVRNSGELLSLSSNVVYEADKFRYWIDDAGEHILFEPNVTAEDRGRFLCAYAIAKTKDGGVYVEVMTRNQIEQVREVSRAKDSGPWKSWFDEMSRKSVIRRLSKRLPMSTDLEVVIRRDDEMYDLSTQRVNGGQSGVDAAKKLLGLPMLPDANPDDDMPALPAGEGEAVDAETGEIIDGEQAAPKPLPEGFDAAAEEKALRSAKSLKALVNAWTALTKKLDGAEMPLELSAAYTEMREALGETSEEL